MICRELIELLEKKYPPSIAESWDNPGLQVGSYEIGRASCRERVSSPV